MLSVPLLPRCFRRLCVDPSLSYKIVTAPLLVMLPTTGGSYSLRILRISGSAWASALAISSPFMFPAEK